MTDLFDRFAVIDVDTHLTEPPDLWTARVPAAMRDQVPRIVRQGVVRPQLISTFPRRPIQTIPGRLLSPGGTLIFSTNFRRFRLDREGLAEFAVEDLSRATLPKDFERNPRIHQCFKLARRR